MDFHTYIRFTVRRPRPKELKISDLNRAEHVFLFDAHYALASSHWQQLNTDGVAKLVVMEALRCPPSSLNNGEDNAVFKSLIGTLIKCPGPGHCADPLFCKAGFFQVTLPESSPQTEAHELPNWIDDKSFTQKNARCASQETHMQPTCLQHSAADCNGKLDVQKSKFWPNKQPFSQITLREFQSWLTRL